VARERHHPNVDFFIQARHTASFGIPATGHAGSSTIAGVRLAAQLEGAARLPIRITGPPRSIPGSLRQKLGCPFGDARNAAGAVQRACTGIRFGS